MNRLFSAFACAGLLAIPTVASADTTFVRADGVTFDSPVGAVCGALKTDIFFPVAESRLDLQDERPLDYLADCFTKGPLTGVRIELVAAWDGSDGSMVQAYERQRAMIGYLVEHGVPSTQLTIAREQATHAGADRVRFRIADPLPWLLLYR